MRSPDEVCAKVSDLEATYAARDGRMARVRDVRAGHMHQVYPEFFSKDMDMPVSSNFIDIVARDLAELVAPLPTLSCLAGTAVSDRARKFASRRQRIGYYYWLHSNLALHAHTAADQYFTYGFAAGLVEPDFAEHFPRIRWIDPWGSYPELTMSGDTHSFTRKWCTRASVLAAQYPEHARQIMDPQGHGYGQDTDLTVYSYIDADQTLVYVHERSDLVLERMSNRLGRCPVVTVVRPSHDGQIRGQFDDILGTQAARSLMMRLYLEATEKQVQAPLAVPDDVQEINIGPDALIRSATPEKIGRVNLGIGPEAFREMAVLDQELRMGARYPEGRSGQMQGSIVTGRGVEALLGTFDTQVKSAQLAFGQALRKLTALAFELDETYWPNERKSIRGTAEGTPFEERYTPSRDIKTDYTCDISYGMMSGMDPNRALVFGLQAQGAGLVPRNWLMRQLPVDVDVTQLEQQIDVERLRDAGIAGVAALVQAMGPIIQSGGDAGGLLVSLGEAIQDRINGKPVEQALQRFAPPPQEEPAPEEMAAGPPPGPGGMDESGLMQGVAAGQAGMPPGGRPALQQLLAGLGSGGDPRMSASIRRNPATVGGR